MPFTGYAGNNPLSMVLPGCGGSGAFGVQSTDCDYNLCQNATVTLTASQIDSMFTTPIVLIPAPGAGLAIIVDSIAFKLVNGGTNFAGGGVVTISYQGGGATVVPTVAAAVVNGATSTTQLAQNATTVTASINQGIQITNATGVFTTGNGTLTLNITYTII